MICLSPKDTVVDEAFRDRQNFSKGATMPSNIFYIIGVVVVVLFILGYLGLR